MQIEERKMQRLLRERSLKDEENRLKAKYLEDNNKSKNSRFKERYFIFLNFIINLVLIFYCFS